MAEPNWKNRTIWTGDNLDIMRGMNSESVELIYLDPPFNSNANYAAPIGTQAGGAEFKDTWSLSDLNVKWLDLLQKKTEQIKLWRVIQATQSNSDKSYLIYMAIRLLEMKRLLKPTGSIYIHCDPTMSHYLKILMDAIFGRGKFRNEIVWSYQRWTGATKHFQRMHDTILFYAEDCATFNILKEPYSKKSKHKAARHSTFVEGKIEQVYTDNTHREKALRDVWEISYINSQAKERTGYPTQKPLALLDRVIRASSNEGDTVFDPFCGCATTLVAADRLNRNWVGIDISPVAVRLVNERIKDDQPDVFIDVTDRADIPSRTDLGKIPPYNTPKNKTFLYGEQRGDCNGCDVHFLIQNMTIDHIIPTSKGGTDHIENLQLLCHYCNSVKGNRTQEYLLTRLADSKPTTNITKSVSPNT